MCSYLVCHCIGTQTLATSPSHIPPLHHKILFCFALQTNICYNWKNIWVRVEVAYDPENCFCIVQIEFQINTALNDRLCIILTNTVPRYRIINCHSFKKIQKLKWVTFKSDFWLCWYKHLCLSLLKSFSIQLMFILVNCLLGARLTETVKTLLTRSSEPGRGRGPAGWHTPLIVLRGESEKTSDDHRDQIYRIFPQPAVAVYQQVTHSKHVRNVGRDCTILREGVYLVFYTLRIFST